jgi:hypothetical protein
MKSIFLIYPFFIPNTYSSFSILIFILYVPNFLTIELLYITLFADLETYYISKLIVSNIKSNINNYIKEEDKTDILYKILISHI